MAATDGLELPVGLTERQFMQQVARLESRLAKMEKTSTQSFVRSNRQISRSFQDLEASVGRSLRNMATGPIGRCCATIG